MYDIEDERSRCIESRGFGRCGVSGRLGVIRIKVGVVKVRESGR